MAKTPTPTTAELKPAAGEQSGAFIQRVILEGHTTATGGGMCDKELANVVLKHYPEQKTTHKDVAWNRWKLRKDGRLPKPTTGKAAAASKPKASTRPKKKAA